jgi:transaldolase
MGNPSITSLIQTGTKLYLDSIDPNLIDQNIEWGAVGATSNPIIVSNLVRTGRFDDRITKALRSGLDNESICWDLTDALVSQAQQKFESLWENSRGNVGWVSFELDPLLEDPAKNIPHALRVQRYLELGRKWSYGQRNRMIKVPATVAGLEALETLAAEGVTLNVTLIFTRGQYLAARDAIWRGAQKRSSLGNFKSVYSIFVSRIDQYTAEHCPELSFAAQGSYGILNAKRIWTENRQFWSNHPTPLQQEIIFASTGTKNASDAPWKYVAALAGSDIQTNPPETNAAIAASDQQFSRQLDAMPPETVCQELDRAVRVDHMEATLMEQGVAKFVAPQKLLIATIAEKRANLLAGA